MSVPAPLIPQGYLIKEVEVRADNPAHFVGSVPTELGSLSPNTGRALLQLLSLDLSDPRLGLSTFGVERLPLLYSWTCGVHQGRFFYQVKVDSVIRIIDYSKGSPEPGFPYSNYPASYRHVDVVLTKLSADEQILVEKINEGDDDSFELGLRFPHLALPRSQVGGIPRLMQATLPEESCPLCGRVMKLFACMANQLPGGERQTENDFVQVVYLICADCMTVSASNYCD